MLDSRLYCAGHVQVMRSNPRFTWVSGMFHSIISSPVLRIIKLTHIQTISVNSIQISTIISSHSFRNGFLHLCYSITAWKIKACSWKRFEHKGWDVLAFCMPFNSWNVSMILLKNTFLWYIQCLFYFIEG